MHLQGKVALLTGVKRIGGVVAEALAEAGCDVALVFNRSATEAERTAARIRETGRRAILLQANLADPNDCHSVVDDTLDQLGRVDVFVAMAGLYTGTPFEKLSLGVWNEQMDVELRSAFLCAHAAVPSMKQNGAGRIILFSDWLPASERPRYAGYLTYYVAKAGLKALAEAMALELAEDNITVNAIAPGPILAAPETTQKELEAVAESTPLGRWGGEGEISKAVLFLCESDFITGETIRVDGGRHVR
ncbi:MAG TPA: SDR family oxidoreductase [Vicinamibacterales bacterium]|nr:SDR family oxidoreductase [Vicinamibacterales bacterium]